MSIKLGTNINSLKSIRRLENGSQEIARVFERLSSGQRINRAADDAAGLSVAATLSVDSRVYTQGIRNLNDGISALHIAQGATQELSNITIRIRELATQAANKIFGLSQRKALDKEAQALADEYLRISRATSFNGVRIFDGSTSEIRLQAGYGINGGITGSYGGRMGSGGFSQSGLQTTEPFESLDVATGDIDGDGDIDIATIGSDGFGTGSITVRRGRGDGSYFAPTSYSTSFTSTEGTIDLIDVNLDGQLDIVYATDTTVGVRLGNGDGTFAADTSFIGYSESGVNLAIHDFSLSDINGDGINDLTLVGEDGVGTGFAAIRLGRGDGTFGAAYTYTTEAGFSYSVTYQDINGDNKLDLVTAGGDFVNGFATIRLGNGDGSFGAAVSYATELNFSAAVKIADFNNDGKLDLITAGTDSVEGYATLRLGNGDGTFSTATSFSLGSSSWTAYDILVGDYNGDGEADIALALFNELGVALGNGRGGFSAFSTYATSSSLRKISQSDTNNDGIYDILGAGTSGVAGYFTQLTGLTRAGLAPLLEFSLNTVSDAKRTMSLMDQNLANLSKQQGVIGALESRVMSAVATLRGVNNSYASAIASIRDADIAEETSNMIRLQILNQTSSAVLAQANLEPKLTLKLLTLEP